MLSECSWHTVIPSWGWKQVVEHCLLPAALQGGHGLCVLQGAGLVPPLGTLCCGLVSSQLNISKGCSHHLVWFKVKLPEWDGRADLFFLALLPLFSPAQQKKKSKGKKKIGKREREVCMRVSHRCARAWLCACVFCSPSLWAGSVLKP